MKHLIIFILALSVAICRAAVPTFNDFNPNQFASNVFKVTVKGGALMTNTIFRPASPGAGAFGTPNFKFSEGTDTFTLQDLGPNPIWTFDSAGETYTFFFPIHGDGSGLTNLPSTGGILTLNGLGTNTTFRGPVTNLPTAITDTGGIISMFIPPTNSVAGQPLYQQWWTLVSTGTNRQFVFNKGYNVGPTGVLDTNHMGLQESHESGWDPFPPSNIEQWEQYWTVYPRSNGTPYRIFSNTIRDSTGESRFNTDLFSLADKTSNIPSFTVSLDLATHASTVTVLGQIVTITNAQNNGDIVQRGGSHVATVPTGYAASSVYSGVDYANGLGFRPHYYSYFTGTPKSWLVSGPTNWSATETVFFIHGAASRIQATNAHFGNITNTATTAAIVWADSNGKQGEATIGSGLSLSAGGELTASGGSGDTNAISYLPNLVNAAQTRNLANGVPVFDVARWTNGVAAISITNTGSDTDSFGIKDSTGGDRFRFTSGISLMTVNSGGPFQLHVDETTIVEDYQTGIRRLHDANGNLAIDFSDAADVQMTTLAPTTVNASTVNLLEGGRIALDAALSADGTYSATVTRAGTAGATLAFGDLIVLDPTDSRWELADANSASGADGDARGMIGICILAAAADGDPTVVLLQGVVRADAVFPSFTVNAPIYVSETAGDITGTLPTTEDNVVRRLGSATTADEIYFNPGDWSTYDVP